MLILIVDDDRRLSDRYRQVFEELSNVKVIEAHSSEEFNQRWEENPEYDLIILDGCLDTSNTPDTIPLIKKIQETSKSPIIAATSMTDARKNMIEAGCIFGFDKSSIGSAAFDTFFEKAKGLLNL